MQTICLILKPIEVNETVYSDGKSTHSENTIIGSINVYKCLKQPLVNQHLPLVPPPDQYFSLVFLRHHRKTRNFIH